MHSNSVYSYPLHWSYIEAACCTYPLTKRLCVPREGCKFEFCVLFSLLDDKSIWSKLVSPPTNGCRGITCILGSSDDYRYPPADDYQASDRVTTGHQDVLFVFPTSSTRSIYLAIKYFCNVQFVSKKSLCTCYSYDTPYACAEFEDVPGL